MNITNLNDSQIFLIRRALEETITQWKQESSDPFLNDWMIKSMKVQIEILEELYDNYHKYIDKGF